MKAVDFVKLSIETSSGWIMGLAEDAKNIPFQRPTRNGGNHPLWILGHLAYSEGNLVSEWCQGVTNPVADWAEKFGMGSQPSDNADDYPPVEEVFAKLGEIRAATLAFVESLADEDLDKPSHAEEAAREWFPTIGHCLAAVANHFCFHGGQLADARRAAGRDPLMG